MINTKVPEDWNYSQDDKNLTLLVLWIERSVKLYFKYYPGLLEWCIYYVAIKTSGPQKALESEQRLRCFLLGHGEENGNVRQWKG